MSSATPAVYVIESDPANRASLELMLADAGLCAVGFGLVEEFLEQHQEAHSGCVLAEMGDGGMAAIERLCGGCQRMPIIMLSSEADIPTVVAAMKLGVLDFLQKPIDAEMLTDTVLAAMEEDVQRRSRDMTLAQIADRFDGITSREREILELLAQGNSNKQIAAALRISLKTVQHHRAHLMAKTNAANVADLVRLKHMLAA